MQSPVEQAEAWLATEPSCEEGMQTIDNICHLMLQTTSVELRQQYKVAIDKIRTALSIQAPIQLPE